LTDFKEEVRDMRKKTAEVSIVFYAFGHGVHDADQLFVVNQAD